MRKANFGCAFVSCVGAVLLPTVAAADRLEVTERGAFILQQDEQLRVNVADHDDIRLALFSERDASQASPATPSVDVREYGSFECDVESVMLVESVRTAAGRVRDVFEIQVDWSPGVDTSGCFVSVTRPDGVKVSAEIYMSY